jgi:hypothetical protein
VPRPANDEQACSGSASEEAFLFWFKSKSGGHVQFCMKDILVKKAQKKRAIEAFPLRLLRFLRLRSFPVPDRRVQGISVSFRAV